MITGVIEIKEKVDVVKVKVAVRCQKCGSFLKIIWIVEGQISIENCKLCYELEYERGFEEGKEEVEANAEAT